MPDTRGQRLMSTYIDIFWDDTTQSMRSIGVLLTVEPPMIEFTIDVFKQSGMWKEDHVQHDIQLQQPCLAKGSFPKLRETDDCPR